jgi:hypothetical protein
MEEYIKAEQESGMRRWECRHAILPILPILRIKNGNEYSTINHITTRAMFPVAGSAESEHYRSIIRDAHAISLRWITCDASP